MTKADQFALSATLGRLWDHGSATGLGEAQLLDRFLREGDEAALEMIVRLHGPMVLGVCRRQLANPHDAEDAFQATFLLLVKNAGEIRDRRALASWLHGAARRIASRIRSDSRRRRTREFEATDLSACLPGARCPGETAEMREIVDDEVARLAEKFRSPLILCDLEGSSLEEAAAKLRCPVGTVKSRLSRAREKLRARLVRRGLAPSIAVMAGALAPDSALQARTTELASSTVVAARLFLSGANLTETVPVRVVNVVRITSRSMSAMKMGMVVFTAVGIVAAGQGMGKSKVPPKAPEPKATTASITPPADHPANDAGSGVQATTKPKAAGPAQEGPAPNPARAASPAAGAVAKAVRPGMDARSQAILARLEESIPMNFPNPTPVEEVLKYIQQATAGPDGEGIQIYVDPVDPSGDDVDGKFGDGLMKMPIRINLIGVPLRRILKLVAEQIGMGVGIKDGVVTMRMPDMRRRNWNELLVLEESFPNSSPLDQEVDRARRGELSDDELSRLGERLKVIEDLTRRYRSIQMPRMQQQPGVQAGGGLAEPQGSKE